MNINLIELLVRTVGRSGHKQPGDSHLHEAFLSRAELLEGELVFEYVAVGGRVGLELHDPMLSLFAT